jgi:hypothetical protein
MRPGTLRAPAAIPAPQAPPDPALAAFEAECEALASDLDAAVERAGLSRDPYRHLIEAQARLVRFYPRMVRVMQQARASTPATKSQADEMPPPLKGPLIGFVLRHYAGHGVRWFGQMKILHTCIAVGVAFLLGVLTVLAALAFK